jgi:hypothetical protein
MNKKQKQIKENWLADFRSEKYKQTQGTLYSKRTKGFCCLGVLQHRLLNGEIEKNYEKLIFDDAEAPAAMPSDLFLDSFGLNWVKENALYLSELNDDNGLSFCEIADYIEVNWK